MRIIPLKLSVTTCYLIRTCEGYLLIDTGYAEDWALFCKRLREAGVAFQDIRWLLLTHHHDDHVGLIHRVLEQNPEIRVILSAPCAELIQNGENDRTHGGGLLNRRVAALLRFKQAYVSLKTGSKAEKANNLKFSPYTARPEDIVVAADTPLDALGLPLKAELLTTPGHTPDSISLLFPDGDCLCGDAAAHMLAFAGTHYCVIFVTDLDEYYQSWDKLLTAGAQTIYPAHGRPFPAQRLSRNRGRNRAQDVRA